MNALEKIQQIEVNIKKLAQTLAQLRADNVSIADENRQLKEQLLEEKNKASLLAQRLKLIADHWQATKHNYSDTEKTKQATEQYMQEIDKCIISLQENH